MMRSEAHVATPLARRYLTQLAKHFQHKIPVELTETTARIAFPYGTCLLDAEETSLAMRAEAADDAALAQLEGVVARHLERFAFRDALQVAWQRG